MKTNLTSTPFEWISDIYKCPKCGGDIRASGFSGNLFCWGKCYHYLNDEEIKAAKEFAQQSESRGERREVCPT